MIPLTLGSIIPVSILLKFVFSGLSVIDFNTIFQTTFYSISLATVGASIVMIVSFLMMLVSNYKSNSFQKILIFLSSCGYAFPGTILAVGIVVFVGWLNDLIYFHLSYTLGGLLVLIFAYTTRFLAVGNGALKSGFQRINPNILEASKTMGIKFSTSLRKLIFPLIFTNILVGAILVFVDILKELPITLLLRPFNFETLATYVYQYASDEMLKESSFAAIIIIFAGLGPVIYLNSTIKKISQKKQIL